MKPCIFTGSAVAIVTPFRAGSIDFNAFDRLVERQIQGGTDAIVVCGTTGEAATLNYDERMALIERCVRIVDRRVPVIAGSGTNNTPLSRFPKPRRAPALTRCSPSRRTTTKPRKTALYVIFPPSPTQLRSLSFSTMSPRAPASAARLRPIKSSPSTRISQASRRRATILISFRKR